MHYILFINVIAVFEFFSFIMILISRNRQENFLRKNLKKFKVLDCLVSCGKYSKVVELIPVFGLFLLVLFDIYVHFASCIKKQNCLCYYNGRQIDRC